MFRDRVSPVSRKAVPSFYRDSLKCIYIDKILSIYTDRKLTMTRHNYRNYYKYHKKKFKFRAESFLIVERESKGVEE